MSREKLYLFGGEKSFEDEDMMVRVEDYRNDLWEYDPAANKWRWIKGSDTVNKQGYYDTPGVAAAVNIPGGRSKSAFWELEGNLYVFGGQGIGVNKDKGFRGDLWMTKAPISGAPAPVIAYISEDTGTSSSDKITKDQSLLIYGTAQANASVTLYKGGVVLSSEIIADQNGIWVYDLTKSILDPGVHIFTAITTSNGTVSPESPEVKVTIDITAPEVTGVADKELYNSEVEITFSDGTATLNSTPFTSGTKVDEEGDYLLQVIDNAGNITEINFILDKTKPVASFAINNGERFTNNASVTLSIATEEVGAQMRFSNDASVWSDWEPVAVSKEWVLSDGNSGKTVFMELEDAAGNVASFTSSIIMDNQSPTVAISSSASNPTNVSPIPVDIQFSEVVSGFDASDLIVSNGTVTSFKQEVAWNYKTQLGTGTLGTSQGQFNAPNGVTLDRAGNIYVMDHGNHRVQILNSDHEFVRQLGTGVPGSGAGEFNLPIAVAVDNDYNVYVADRSNHRVQIFNKDGLFLKQLGTGVAGNGDDQFNVTTGVAIDSKGNIYVSDERNHRVKVYSKEHVFLRQIGTGLQGTGQGEFFRPSALAVDSQDQLYVADTNNNRVQVFDENGNFIRQIGSGTQGTGVGEFYFPRGLAVDAAENLYVSETLNHRIQIFDKNGAFLSQFGKEGNSYGEFQNPFGIALKDNLLYVTDPGNHRVQMLKQEQSVVANITLDQDGEVTVNIAANAATDLAGNGNTAATEFKIVYDTAAPVITSIKRQDPAEEVTKADELVFRVTFSEAVTGVGTEDFLADTKGGHPAAFVLDVTPVTGSNLPNATVYDVKVVFRIKGSGPVALQLKETHDIKDLAGNVLSGGFTAVEEYLIDLDPPMAVVVINNNASHTTSANVTLALATGDAVAMQFSNDGTTWTEWEEIAETKEWTLTSGEGMKTVYIRTKDIVDNFGQNQDNITLDVTAPTVAVTSSAPNPTNSSPIPFEIKFSESISDFEAGDVTVQNGSVTSLSGKLGDISFWKRVGLDLYNQGLIAHPRGVAVGPDGNIYMAESDGVYRDFVQVFSKEGVYLYNFEVPNFDYEGEPVGSSIGSLAVDKENNIYVAATRARNVQVYNKAGQLLSTIDGSSSGLDPFATIEDIATDEDGKVYLVDSRNRVMVFQKDGAFVKSFGSTGLGDGQLQYPSGIAVSKEGLIYILDSENRVQVFSNSGVFQRKILIQNPDAVDPMRLIRIALDGFDNLYALDRANGRVVVSSTDGTYLRGFGSLGVEEGEFWGGISLAVDSEGKIYVADNSVSSISILEQPLSYVALVTPTADGEVKVSVAANAVQDHAGLGSEASNQLSIVYDGTAPTVVTVTLPEDKTYQTGDQLDYKVTFSEEVIISGEDSHLKLMVGTTGREAAFLSKTANSITYRYTVQPGDLETDGVALGRIALGTSSIKDAAGNVADLSFSSGANGVLVDGVVPTIVSVSAPQDKTYTIGDKLSFTVNFSENVVVTGQPYLTLSLTDRSGAVRYESGSGTQALTFSYTVRADDFDFDGVALGNFITLAESSTIKDVAGNNASLLLHGVDPLAGVLIDGVAPVVAQVAAPANGSYKAGQNLDFTVTFSEEVTVTGTPALTLTVGSTDRAAAYVSGSGTTALLFRYTVQASELDADGVALANAISLNGGTIRDAAGNNASQTLTNVGNTAQVLVDAVLPSVVISSEAPNPLNGSYSVTLTFSEAVTGLEESEITVENGTATGLLSLDNRVYTVIIVPTADGEVKVSVPVNVALDVAQNGNTASNVLTRVFDATRPTVALTSPVPQEVNAPFTVTFTFSENVNNFIQGDITVANGQASAFNQTSPSVYTALITPTAQGTVTVSVAADMAEDAATNGNEASSQLTRTYDSVAPAGYAVAFVQTMIDFENQTNATVRVTGAEVGASYAYRITSATGGTAVAGSGTASAANFDLTGLNLTDLGDGQLTVTFSQVDAAGNSGADAIATVTKLTRNITAITRPAVMKVPIRTAFAQVPLPTTVEVTYSDNSKETVPVTWRQGDYNGLVAGPYELSGTLTLSPGTTNLNSMVPEITVEVQPNKAPADITLSKDTFQPSIGPDEAIGTFTTADADDPINGEPENQHLYELVTGAGSTDNALFAVDGNQLYLKSNSGLSGKTSFSIRVRSVDPYGNTFEKTFTLTKEGYAVATPDLKIVNAFSPNGDGVNDTWTVPEMRFYNSVEVQVFDRSGVRLFHTTNPEQGWDGKNRNGQVLPGQYLYTIHVKDINFVKRGTVTILKK